MRMLIRPSTIAALAGFGAGFAYREYRGDLARARARVAAGSSVVETSCGPIEHAAAGDGRPVVVVHGAGGGFDQGMEIGRPFADRFRVIAMSRFGYLRTPLPEDASASAQADAHAALLDALGIERASVIGVSAGAPSALELAIRHPDRVERLVLFVPALYVPRPQRAPSVSTPPWVELLSSTVLRSDFLFWSAAKAAVGTLARSILGTPPELVAAASADEQARVRNFLELMLPITERRLGLINDGRICAALTRCELDKVRAPTLAISFADDLYGTYDAARYTCEQLPDGRFVPYPTGGHLGIGHEQHVIDEIAGFIGA
jgi:pimeloyl-ACP methyl ester carboxylesterase